MADREKLFALLTDCKNPVWNRFFSNSEMLQLTEYLITNGVTVREWISVKDELPKSEVLAANFAPGTHGYKEHIIGFVSGERCTESGRCVAENDYEILHDVTHWMPLPEPLKEESHADAT